MLEWEANWESLRGCLELAERQDTNGVKKLNCHISVMVSLPSLFLVTGGAPVEDLKKLAGSQVAMDIKTFTNLKPEELEVGSSSHCEHVAGLWPMMWLHCFQHALSLSEQR